MARVTTHHSYVSYALVIRDRDRKVVSERLIATLFDPLVDLWVAEGVNGDFDQRMLAALSDGIKSSHIFDTGQSWAITRRVTVTATQSAPTD